jgi:predicted chitinase
MRKYGIAQTRVRQAHFLGQVFLETDFLQIIDWAYKHHSGHRDINRVADQPFSPDTISRICILVNGGGNGLYERHAYTQFIARELGDDPADSHTTTYIVPVEHHHASISYHITVDFTRPEEANSSTSE